MCPPLHVPSSSRSPGTPTLLLSPPNPARAGLEAEDGTGLPFGLTPGGGTVGIAPPFPQDTGPLPRGHRVPKATMSHIPSRQGAMLHPLVLLRTGVGGEP